MLFSLQARTEGTSTREELAQPAQVSLEPAILERRKHERVDFCVKASFRVVKDEEAFKLIREIEMRVLEERPLPPEGMSQADVLTQDLSVGGIGMIGELS